MHMRETINLVESLMPVFQVPPMPDDFAPREERIAYLAPILANEFVGKLWNRRNAVRKASQLLDDVGGYGGYNNEAWLDQAREYIAKS